MLAAQLLQSKYHVVAWQQRKQDSWKERVWQKRTFFKNIALSPNWRAKSFLEIYQQTSPVSSCPEQYRTPIPKPFLAKGEGYYLNLIRQAWVTSSGWGSFINEKARLYWEGNHPCPLHEALDYRWDLTSGQDDDTKNISTVHSKYFLPSLWNIPFIRPLLEQNHTFT